MTDTPTFLRDDRGLVKGLDYKFKPDGKVDYRALLRPEHLAVNDRSDKRKEALLAKYGKPAKELKVSDVSDDDLLILLNGIRYIAGIRGYTAAIPDLKVSGPEYASVRTLITWLPNYETSMNAVTTGDCGNAHVGNVSAFVTPYLETIATNRAFVRTVRAFLEIPILGADEIKSGSDAQTDSAPAPVQGNPFDPHVVLERIAGEAKPKKLTFASIKKGALEHRSDMTSDPEKWEKWTDIPPTDCTALIGFIKDKEAATSSS